MFLPTFAKPVLYEVPTYLAGCPIGTLNRKTKRKKAMDIDTSKCEINYTDTSIKLNEIPFPLQRQMPYRDGIITLMIDYGKLGKQMYCWTWNELNEWFKK